MLVALVLCGCIRPPQTGAAQPGATRETTATPVAATTRIAVPTTTAVAPLARAVGWTPPPRTKTSGCTSHDGLPDADCTPGAVDPRVERRGVDSTICTRGYTAMVRPSVSVTDRIKREQMPAYGLEGQRFNEYELDHLISLELGGAPDDVANLWPEPRSGAANAHMKDAVENFLNRQVCRGLMPLAEAQRQIATNWLAVYTSQHLVPAQ